MVLEICQMARIFAPPIIHDCCRLHAQSHNGWDKKNASAFPSLHYSEHFDKHPLFMFEKCFHSKIVMLIAFSVN